MNLEPLGRQDAKLNRLLQQTAHWQRLDQSLKQLLPPHLHSHFQVACVADGRLVVIAGGSMAAARLRMLLPPLVPQLQIIDSEIQSVRVTIRPTMAEAPRDKRLHLSSAAADTCRAAADRLAHHPELAAALRALGRRGG